MPAVIPLAVAAASAVGGDISSNVAAKSANANADNKADAARKGDKQALQTALSNLAGWNKANPSPASQYTMGAAPASVGGGVFGGSSGVAQQPGALQGALQQPQAAQSQSAPQGSAMPPRIMQIIAAAMQPKPSGAGMTGQPVARTANPSVI
jgi:hypothetical protein